jgi:S-DNA-T family DNA segregation ATPase FtsK/SpoIIIE
MSILGPPKKKKYGEVFGVFLFIIAILIFISLLSYDAGDLSDSRDHITNKVGIVGAYTSYALMLILGYVSYLIPISLIILGIIKVMGRSNKVMFGKLVSIVPTVIAFSTLSALFCPYTSLKDLQMRIDWGGTVGLMISEVIISIIGRIGAFVILFAAVLVSIVLYTDVSLVLIFSWIGRIFSGVKVPLFKVGKEEVSEGGLITEVGEEQTTGISDIKMVGEEKRSTVGKIEVKEEKVEEGREVRNILPPIDLLNKPTYPRSVVTRAELDEKLKILQMGLSQYGVRIGKCKEGSIGPRFTRFLVPLEAGERISRMENLERELALLFKVDRVRITAESGRSGFIGVEVPNAKERLVFIREAFETDDYKGAKGALPITLGLDQQGRARIADLAEMPHLLIAGATGSGKSVFVNVIILSLLYRFTQDYVRFLMVDLKRVELEGYGQKERSLPHLLYQVMTTPDNAVIGLRWAVSEMEARYQLLAQVGARHISGYNQKMVKEKREPSDEEHPVFSALDSYKLPYLIIIIDELGDLMSTQGRKIEVSLTRLAQMSRAIGIHLIVATQRPSVDVITGLIKANFPVRASFRVTSKVDSRTILDRNGAENMLGKGDYLFLPVGQSEPIRLQSPLVVSEEINRVVDFLMVKREPPPLPKEEEGGEEETEITDEFYNEAVNIVVSEGQASISLLQRKLSIGYARAGRLIDIMERNGVVGPSEGSKPRQVLKGR